MKKEFKIGDKIYFTSRDFELEFTFNKHYTIISIDSDKLNIFWCWIIDNNGSGKKFANESYEKFLKRYDNVKCERLERKYKLNKLFKNE